LIGAKSYYCPFFNKNDQFDRRTFHKLYKSLNTVSEFIGKSISQNQKKDYLFDNVDTTYIDKLLFNSPYVVLVPGSGEKEKFKRWPVKEFANFCSLFIEKYPQFKIIITGTLSEAELAKKIIRQVNNKPIINLCGQVNIRQLTGVYRNAQFVLGGDNGGLHLAKASGGRVVAIMGPTNSALTGPIDAELIIDRQLPGTPWYCREALKKRKYDTYEESMQVPAELVLGKIIKNNLL